MRCLPKFSMFLFFFNSNSIFKNEFSTIFHLNVPSIEFTTSNKKKLPNFSKKFHFLPNHRGSNISREYGIFISSFQLAQTIILYHFYNFDFEEYNILIYFAQIVKIQAADGLYAGLKKVLYFLVKIVKKKFELNFLSKILGGNRKKKFQ